jgi:hypothetical protein
VLQVFATSLTRRADSQTGQVIDDAHRQYEDQRQQTTSLSRL